MNIRSILYGTFLILAVADARADLAVRDLSISENEFRARCSAGGQTSMSDWLTSEQSRKLPGEFAETFRLRLIEAQREWLERTPTTLVTPNIDRFLSLATEADWSKSERESFITFFIRKFETTQGDAFARTQLHHYLLGAALDLRTLSPLRKSDWLQNVNSAKTEWLSFEPVANLLPKDVVAVLINGQTFEREALRDLKVPPTAFRLTLISNVYQPTSLKIESIAALKEIPNRTTWIDESCRVNVGPANLEEDGQVQRISKLNCQNAPTENLSENSKVELKTTSNTVSATMSDSNIIEKFGIGKRSESLPVLPSPTSKSLLEKPWFWGVVGILAIGTVIAIDRSQNQANIRPVQREGW